MSEDEDENFSVYLYALAAAAAVLVIGWLLTPQQIEVKRIALDAVDVGAIETASITPRDASEIGAGWNPDQIPWRSYEDGMRRMAQTGKRGVLVLQADWCLVCRSYQKLFKDKDVTKHADDYVFMIADIENTPELQRSYDIDGDYVPRTFLLNSDGSLARQATGEHPRQRFFVDPFRPEELTRLLDDAQ